LRANQRERDMTSGLDSIRLMSEKAYLDATYASLIKENMMLEDPASAIEQIYREMYAKVEIAAASRNRNK
jgi:hypothetical protein